MDKRIDDGSTAMPLLEGTARDITKKNIKDGTMTVDPTKRMTQKEYADLLERSPTLQAFWKEVRGSFGEVTEGVGRGQFSTPQDDAVISNYKKTQALTTSVSNQFNKAVANLRSTFKTGTSSTDKVDVSKAKEKVEELEGILSFVKENELYTKPFKASIESGLANASDVWKSLKSLNLKDNFPRVYEALIVGLAIRGDHGKSEINDLKGPPPAPVPSTGR